MGDKETPVNKLPDPIFQTWANEQIQAGKFQDDTVVVYRSIWQAWTDWLLSRKTLWAEASASDVMEFLGGPAPGQRRHRQPIRAEGLANFTQQRYWRVLRGIYASAKRLELIAENPTMGVPDELRPTITRRSLLPQVLPPGMLARLQQPETIVQLIPVLKDTHWWSLRNRAAMAVLTHLGLTTSELGQLSAMALRIGGVAWVDHVGEWAQNTIDGTPAPASIWLDVPRGGALQGRSLQVPDVIVPMLRLYLNAHHQLYSQRLLKGPRQGARKGINGIEDDLRTRLRRAPLFPSRKCVGGDKLNLPGIDEVTVFELVQKVMRTYFASDAGKFIDPRDSGVHMGQGAAIVRNTLVRQWIETLGPQEAVSRAGFDSQESLRQHSAVPPDKDKPKTLRKKDRIAA